jgi:predicted RNA-binding Zn ribbon-like protein
VVTLAGGWRALAILIGGTVAILTVLCIADASRRRRQRVESFLNSVDVESGQDDLDTVTHFRRWLGDHHRKAAADAASQADLAFARELRTALRELLRHHDSDAPPAIGAARLDALAGRIPLRVRLAGGQVGLAPAAAGVPGVLGEVLGAIALADRGGTWRRLKLCRADTCQVVFYDRSKNGSRCWCSMEVCGNRSKIRAYRGRRAAR